MTTMTCEKCGDSFSCGVNDMDKPCWCVSAPKLKEIPIQYNDCLCPKCLISYKDTSQINEDETLLIENE